MKLCMIDDTRSNIEVAGDRDIMIMLITLEQRERIREWSKNGYRDQLAGMQRRNSYY